MGAVPSGLFSFPDHVGDPKTYSNKGKRGSEEGKQQNKKPKFKKIFENSVFRIARIVKHFYQVAYGISYWTGMNQTYESMKRAIGLGAKRHLISGSRFAGFSDQSRNFTWNYRPGQGPEITISPAPCRYKQQAKANDDKALT